MTLPLQVHYRCAIATLLLGVFCPGAYSQSPEQEPLRLDGLAPAGTRGSLTESWASFRIDMRNTGGEPRDARVIVFYPEQPDIHYARDVHLPGHSMLTTWMTVGPAPEQGAGGHREVEYILYDRTGGHERVVHPAGEQKTRSRSVFYRHREPTFAILPPLEPPIPDLTTQVGEFPEPVVLARAARDAAGLSEYVTTIEDRFLPPVPEAFDGIDLVMLANDRLAGDPAGLQTVRRWVQQGGTLWVLLDQVDLAGIAPLLGDDFDLQVIDRVGLTTMQLYGASSEPEDRRDFDRPVDLVRVTVGATDTIIHKVNGWPASFTRTVGRGRILFTTLGPRGWYRPRIARDPRSRFEHFADSPIPLTPLAELAVRFNPRDTQQSIPADAFRDMLMQEIGYSVVGRRTAAIVFGVFLLALLGLGLWLRRSRRPELLGWFAPIAAIAVAGAFLGIGEVSRSAVPPTVGIVEVVDAVPGSREAAAMGVFALYRPTSGLVPLATNQGAMLNFDQSGLEGQGRQRVVTDLDNWHWENLNLPAGIRLGTFRSSVRATRISAVAKFGPNGLDGHLTTEPFREPADGLIFTPNRQPQPIRFGEKDAFSAHGEDVLPPGQYLNATVLTDRQQRRQTVYRQILGESFPKHWEGNNILLTWAEQSELPFHIESGDRLVGMALLAVPLEFTRPASDTPVTIPAAFVPYSRMLLGRRRPVPIDGSDDIEMELRFQLPPSTLPLKIERVRLAAKIRSPGRQFSVSGYGDSGLVPLFTADNPLDPIHLDIVDPQLLRIDPDGGLRLMVRIGGESKAPTAAQSPTPNTFEKGVPLKKDPPFAKEQTQGKEVDGQVKKGAPVKKDLPFGKEQPQMKEQIKTSSSDLFWKIESLGIEVIGRTAANR